AGRRGPGGGAASICWFGPSGAASCLGRQPQILVASRGCCTISWTPVPEGSMLRLSWRTHALDAAAHLPAYGAPVVPPGSTRFPVRFDFRRPFIAAVLLLAALAMPAPGRADGPLVPDPAAFTQRVFELTNAQRAMNGLPPLTRNAALDRAASLFCRYMFEANFF